VFLGDVDVMPTDMTVTVWVQKRASNGKYKAYKTYGTSVPAYTDDFAIVKTISADGRFRFRVTNSLGGSTGYKYFSTH